MGREADDYCTVYISLDQQKTQPSTQELGKWLASKDDNQKVQALESIILQMVNGESLPNLLMQVIQYTVTSTNHRIKKLLMLYWEVVDKYKETGEWREEMILVCNAIRNDLLSHNEYVRGCTLRLMSRFRYYKILEPLIEAILKNLTHKHSYVRRNAVMCVFAIVKTFGVDVIPTALDDVEQLLLVEGDLSTKRNAFLMLLNCDMERATNYLLSTQDTIGTSGDLFQLAVLELIRKACRTGDSGASNKQQAGNMQQSKTKLLRVLYNLADPTANSISSTAVAYDVASSLVSLTGNAQAVTTAVQNYMSLLTEQSDNNVKLIVLQKLKEVRRYHSEVVQGFIMDAFRGLTSPSLDVRQKVMELCLPLVSSKNVKEVVALFKKELIKTCGTEISDKDYRHQYRRMLIKALHTCTTHSAEEAQSLIYLLIDFLTESEYNVTANETIMYLRELVATFPELRAPIISRLSSVLGDMHHSRVLRGCLWLFSEYCEDCNVSDVFEATLDVLRPLPLVSPKEKDDKPKKKKEDKEKTVQTRTIVLADGTYGTEDVIVKDPSEAQDEEKNKKKSMIKNLLCLGDYLLATCVSVSLTRMILKIEDGVKSGRLDATDVNAVKKKNEVIFVVSNLVRLLKQAHQSASSTNDSILRMHLCIKILTTPVGKEQAVDAVRAKWLGTEGKTDLMRVIDLEAQNSEWNKERNMGDEDENNKAQMVPPGEAICFRQLRRDGRDRVNNTLDFDDEGDFNIARGADTSEKDGSLFGERLANVQQMTGLADAIYVEAFLQVHSFDLLLEVLLVNRTNETLQNCTVEISTQGDLKIVDRPAPVMLAPGQQQIVHASIKVSSTETGVIFGYVSYEKKSAVDKESIVLNELHVDILDYIEKGGITELKFRTMWSEFEWENKININTQFKQAGAYLVHIMRNTNMSLVGRSDPKGAIEAGKEKQDSLQNSVQARLQKYQGGAIVKPTEGPLLKPSGSPEDNPIALVLAQKWQYPGYGAGGTTRKPSATTIMPNTKGSKKHLSVEEIFTQFEDSLGVKKLLKQSNFVAVNLYAKSIFGEDILANVSIETIWDSNGNAKLHGSVRIRSRAQGIALSLGDRISSVQR